MTMTSKLLELFGVIGILIIGCIVGILVAEDNEDE